jgi:5-methylcytosine-specific restriction endonuclease McrBC GTP-binding regulatory subunit McrB
LDYSNTDFVGQIVPVIEYEEDGRSTVTYRFVPGPFTIALECAFEHYNERVALVIEELNRGNAPCIFGDLFQLLDRIDEEGKDYPIGTSEYGILNTSLINYLKDNEHYNKKYKYSFDLDEIRIPANLSIYATMNTSDQNVFTLDTAFKRRWGFEKLSNKFDDSKKGKHPYKDYFVPGLQQVTWESFVNAINNYIVRDNDLLTSEDKQLGVYFVTKKMLIDPSKKEQYTKDELKKIIDKFAYKVFEYLWDDVAKFSRDKWFGNIKTLDELIKKYVNEEKVFADDILQQ